MQTPAVHASGSDTLKIGLVGCGGRESGAVRDALTADPNTKLVAMADTFGDHLDDKLRVFQGMADISARIDVPAERKFVGFDAYQKLMETDVDVVLLASPPHFRPEHIRAAVAAGKHIFAEKPVAVDAAGVRSVLESCRAAQERRLSVVSGLCWRYDPAKQEVMRRIQDGAIGDIHTLHTNYLTSQLWIRPRQPSWSEMEYQVRNWLYYTWLSGDHNTEQHIHSLDKIAWAMGDRYPIACYGLGGRQQRTGAAYGHIYDHHAVVYEFEGGAKCFSFCRQMDGCFNNVNDYIVGTRGSADVMAHVIRGESDWRYSGPRANMYVAEHQALFRSIRDSAPINNGVYMSHSSLMAIMGRMATYTGQRITWEQAMNSQDRLGPTEYAWGPIDVPTVPVPGRTTAV